MRRASSLAVAVSLAKSINRRRDYQQRTRGYRYGDSRPDGITVLVTKLFVVLEEYLELSSTGGKYLAAEAFPRRASRRDRSRVRRVLDMHCDGFFGGST